MKTSFYNLIVVSPDDPRIRKFHLSRRAIIFLIVAFLVSFVVTVALSHSTASEKLSNAEHLRLRTENMSLQVENKNAEIRNQKLEAELADLERLTSRVNALIQAD